MSKVLHIEIPESLKYLCDLSDKECNESIDTRHYEI